MDIKLDFAHLRQELLEQNTLVETVKENMLVIVRLRYRDEMSIRLV